MRVPSLTFQVTQEFAPTHTQAHTLVVESLDSGPNYLSSSLGSTIYYLCDLGQVF